MPKRIAMPPAAYSAYSPHWCQEAAGNWATADDEQHVIGRAASSPVMPGAVTLCLRTPIIADPGGVGSSGGVAWQPRPPARPSADQFNPRPTPARRRSKPQPAPAHSVRRLVKHHLQSLAGQRVSLRGNRRAVVADLSQAAESMLGGGCEPVRAAGRQLPTSEVFTAADRDVARRRIDAPRNRARPWPRPASCVARP